MCMEEKAARFIKEKGLLEDGEAVGVALSGGGDSMALLFLLKKLGYRVSAYHFEHGIRGEQSLSDAKFAEEYCRANDIPFYIEHGDVPAYARAHKMPLEAAARAMRYDFLLSRGKEKIATAHHMDDNAESILMNIVRGCGINGLKGIAVKNGRLIRPLLCVTKSEIEEYLTQNSIPFVTDLTNYDTAYRRNRMRREIIPALRELNPNILSALMRLSESAEDACDFIGEEADKVPVCVSEGRAETDRERLLSLNPQVAAAVIFNMCDAVSTRVDVEKTHVEEILSLSRTGACRHVKNEIFAKYEYGKLIVFTKKDKINDTAFCVPFEYGAVFPGGRLAVASAADYRENTDKNRESLGYIPAGAVVRTRRQGDVFHPLGGKEKKLKDYFIDKKIPAERRDGVPLLAFENRIIWVIGYDISKDFAVSGDDIITLEYIKGE